MGGGGGWLENPVCFEQYQEIFFKSGDFFPGGGVGGGWRLKLALTRRISPVTKRSSPSLFTRGPGDFLLGGMDNLVGIVKEIISEYQDIFLSRR